MIRTEGFYPDASDAAGQWVPGRCAIVFDPESRLRYLSFWVLSEFRDLSQELTMATGGRQVRLSLPGGWSPASVEVPAGANRVDFSVNRLLPAAHHPADPRDLAVRLRDLVLHDDGARHARVARRQANAVATVRHMLDGRARLDSTPPSLGIDMYAGCNIKPPCVYCGFDGTKILESPFVDTPFTLGTLREWGPLFDQSTNLVNCSIGEPFMMKNIDELLDAFADGGKTLELTTNGQILTDRNIQKLLGRPIDLYISFDAATPETYSILRNHRFDQMVANVRRLIEAKGGPGRLPTVNIVFMPMKANVGELDAFIALCADLRPDHLVLRPLNYDEKVQEVWDRAGYHFEYQNELLPFEDLVRTSGRAAELCRQAGVALSDQMDFGGSLGGQFAEWFEEGRRSAAGAQAAAAAPAPPTAVEPLRAEPPDLGGGRLPACTEPWKSLYILRRGVFPCCYGGRPVAPMDQYRDTWNSPLLQAIRADLARGRFHRYCLESPACPIVRKSGAAHDLPVGHELRVRARHAGVEMRRRWQTVVWARQWAAIRLRRVLTEPAYVRRHAGRVWRRLRGAK